MIDIKGILDTLPHRYPILLVDRILELDPGKRIVGLKNVTINEPFFVGHYPGQPVMPGVMILEAMAQAGAIMLLKDNEFKGRIPLFGAIDKAKFKRMVVPGDQLISTLELDWFRGSIGHMRGTATVEGQVAATMEATFKLMD
ncbi:MAG TPA: 3-hydroxyacyl-ACP dehydratase FabZ [Fimbriimonadaceae bacterium]|nr:3-hydroxyacyl-ACP dehydratase FabZ [Fimbriimonadaceae bacterium]